MPNAQTSNAINGLRLDKWLWAARFYKTRNLAKKAIESGKIRTSEGRLKVSRLIKIGEMILIRQASIEKEIEILALSEQRQSYTIAQQLYRETPMSRERREKLQQMNRLANAGTISAKVKPSKKQRRQIQRFQQTHTGFEG